jgi:hypothetical protein
VVSYRPLLEGNPPVGGWVGSTSGLDAVEKRKVHDPARDSNPGHLAHSLVTILTEFLHADL